MNLPNLIFTHNLYSMTILQTVIFSKFSYYASILPIEILIFCLHLKKNF